MKTYNDLNKDYQGGDLDLSNEGLNSLDGCPEHITGVFNCFHNNNLTSLVGGPKQVDGNYLCGNNLLTDLVGCASHIDGRLWFRDNPITSLVGIHKIIKSCKSIVFEDSRITVGGIGLLLIDDLIHISDYSMGFKIISKYIGQGTKGMMACRAELISKGYDNYAKL